MSLFSRKKFESEMQAELEFHIEACANDLMRAGLEPAEARRRARMEFGALEATKDECRQAWGLQRMDELRADLRLALRTLRHNPGFAASAILSLALGIGANTGLVGLVDAVMLRLLPVQDPARLVFVYTAGTRGRGGPPYPFFELIRDHATSFEAVSAFSPSNMEIVIDASREQARGVWVSSDFYQTLGVDPLLGRTLEASDNATAVISRAWWQRRFGGDPAVIGRAIHLFDHTVTIVGVLPSDIMSLEPGWPIDIAVPMPLSDPAKMRDRTSLWLFVVARLKSAVPVEQARAESNAFFQAYMSDVTVPPVVRQQLFDHVDLSPAAKGLSSLRQQFSQPLTAMMILSILVLVAACVNVASLMLARAAARQRDFAVRLAIGAGRGRLIRQTLTEALLLVGAGTAAGLVFAQEGQVAFAAFLAGGSNKIILDLSLNARVLLFTAAVAILSGIAAGILPALRAARVDPAAGLQGASRSVAGSRRSLRLGRSLVVVQVALSLVLLAGAGLFIHTLRQLESVDPGFTREGLLTMEVAPERQLHGTPQWFAAQAEILDRVRRLPGVRQAGWATYNPMSGRGRGATLEIPGFAPGSSSDMDVSLAALSPGYLETLGVPLLMGRAFTPRDDAAAPKVAILNETAARFYFGDRSPLGRKVRFANYPDPNLIYEVVGVVRDVKHDTLREQPRRLIYVPVLQSVDRVNRLALSIRASADPASLAAPVRQAVLDVRSTLLITNVFTMENLVRQSLRKERLIAALSLAFGLLALALACIGLYGILAYAVTRRTNEIGIRMALGATRSATVWMVLREALTLAALGIAFGLPAVLAVAQFTKALLFGVEPLDPLALFAAAALLLTFASLAGFIPARRASRLDAMSALRSD